MLRRNPNRQIAESAGEKYYFSGSPCRSAGHVSERYTSNGACVACGRAAIAVYRAENPEKVAAYNAKHWGSAAAKKTAKAWRDRHPERVKERYVVWISKNRDKRNAKRRIAYVPKPRKLGRDLEAPKRAAKKWREKNREFDKQRATEWRRENPELAAAVTRAWRQKNKEKLLAKENRRRARKKGGGGSYEPSYIREIFFAQKGKCAFCRIKLGITRHIDHIVPLSKSGTSNRRNLQLLCPPCNLAKSDRDQIEFMQAKGRLL